MVAPLLSRERTASEGKDAVVFSYRIVRQQNIVLQEFCGTVGIVDLRDAAIRVSNDPLYRGRMNILMDLRAAELRISYEEIIEYTTFLTRFGPIARQAVVVSRYLEFGLARMFEQLSENLIERDELKVFFDMRAAVNWLGYSITSESQDVAPFVIAMST